MLNNHPLRAAAAGAVLIAFSAFYVYSADVSPATAAFFRCAYALPFLGFMTWREHRRLGPRPRADRLVAKLAGVVFGVNLLLWHYAIEYVGTGLATVLSNTQVVIVGLLAWAILRERPDQRVLVAVPVVLVGVTLISGLLDAEAFGSRPVLGATLGLTQGLTYAGYLLLLRRGLRDLRRMATPIFDAALVASLVAAAAGLVTGDLNIVPSWPSHGWLLLLAIGSQVVAWMLISVSLPRLPAVETSLILLLQPVGALLIGVVILSEAPSALQGVGAMLILSGVAISSFRRSPRQVVDQPG